MERTWFVRLNLDAFNSAAISLDSDQEKAAFFTGLTRGLNGGQLAEGKDNLYQAGYELGRESREETEGYREKQSVKGQKGNEVRWGKNRTGIPGGIAGGSVTINHQPSTINEEPSPINDHMEEGEDESLKQSPTVTKAAPQGIVNAGDKNNPDYIQTMWNTLIKGDKTKLIKAWTLNAAQKDTLVQNIQNIPNYGPDFLNAIRWVFTNSWTSDFSPGLPLLVKSPGKVSEYSAEWSRSQLPTEAQAPPKHVPPPSQFTPEQLQAAQDAKEKRRADAAAYAERLKGIS